uniref:Secreted protein n=1 Tax=Ditylenchus dipsaci TaxID=166011 RepID=A0A915E336_9BILA
MKTRRHHSIIRAILFVVRLQKATHPFRQTNKFQKATRNPQHKAGTSKLKRCESTRNRLPAVRTKYSAKHRNSAPTTLLFRTPHRWSKSNIWMRNAILKSVSAKKVGNNYTNAAVCCCMCSPVHNTASLPFALCPYMHKQQHQSNFRPFASNGDDHTQICAPQPIAPTAASALLVVVHRQGGEAQKK